MFQQIKSFYNKYNTIFNPIVFGLAGAGLLYIIIYFSVGDPIYFKDWKKEKGQFQHNIDSATKVNQDLNSMLDHIPSDTFYQKQKIYLIKKDDELNKVTNEKINRINSFDVDSLQRFFTERYDSSSK